MRGFEHSSKIGCTDPLGRDAPKSRRHRGVLRLAADVPEPSLEGGVSTN